MNQCKIILLLCLFDLIILLLTIFGLIIPNDPNDLTDNICDEFISGYTRIHNIIIVSLLWSDCITWLSMLFYIALTRIQNIIGPSDPGNHEDISPVNHSDIYPMKVYITHIITFVIWTIITMIPLTNGCYGYWLIQGFNFVSWQTYIGIHFLICFILMIFCALTLIKYTLCLRRYEYEENQIIV